MIQNSIKHHTADNAHTRIIQVTQTPELSRKRKHPNYPGWITPKPRYVRKMQSLLKRQNQVWKSTSEPQRVWNAITRTLSGNKSPISKIFRKLKNLEWPRPPSEQVRLWGAVSTNPAIHNTANNYKNIHSEWPTSGTKHEGGSQYSQRRGQSPNIPKHRNYSRCTTTETKQEWIWDHPTPWKNIF